MSPLSSTGSGSPGGRATSAPPEKRRCLLIPYVDEMNRMCVPHSHGTRWCTWHDAGFHKFDPNANVPHSVPSHANTSAYLRSVRDHRLFLEERRHSAFNETYRSAKEDVGSLSASNQRYGNMMAKILRPETPPIVRIKRAEHAPKPDLKDILRELHERNRKEKAEIKEKLAARHK